MCSNVVEQCMVIMQEKGGVCATRDVHCVMVHLGIMHNQCVLHLV